jgi:HEAT repeat protein
LAEFGPKAVPELIRVLEQDKYLDEVFSLLAQIGDKRAIRPIFVKINSSAWETANNARGALREFGNAAVPTLLEGLNDAKYYDASIDVLKDIHPDNDSLALARKLLRDGNSKQRAAAAYLLGTWRDKGSVADIENSLKDNDIEVRTKAFEGYKTLFTDDPSGYSQKIILDLLSDADPHIRREAVRLVRDNFAQAAAPAIIKMAKDEKDSEVRYAVLSTLAKIDDPAVIVILLETLMKEKDQHVLSAAVYSLGGLKAEESLPYIQGLFKDRTVGAELEEACIYTFIDIGKPVDVDPLLDYFDKVEIPHEAWPLLQLLDTMAKPGDEKVVLALEKFRPRAESQQMAELIDSILKKMGAASK